MNYFDARKIAYDVCKPLPNGEQKDTVVYYAIQAAIAAAKWMAGQEVEAYCVESSNPVSENPKQRLHCITIVYEEKEDTPYVLGGDKVIIQIRKK